MRKFLEISADLSGFKSPSSHFWLASNFGSGVDDIVLEIGPNAGEDRPRQGSSPGWQ